MLPATAPARAARRLPTRLLLPEPNSSYYYPGVVASLLPEDGRQRDSIARTGRQERPSSECNRAHIRSNKPHALSLPWFSEELKIILLRPLRFHRVGRNPQAADG